LCRLGQFPTQSWQYLADIRIISQKTTIAVVAVLIANLLQISRCRTLVPDETCLIIHMECASVAMDMSYRLPEDAKSVKLASISTRACRGASMAGHPLMRILQYGEQINARIVLSASIKPRRARVHAL
jgi:hypothetical protein